ncbi:hypothetical protein [Halomonas sp. CKK8]|uniref:hypothetical protein n=1 Tax=Halomonas sp. CKK8 TaxID=3036127 RepID=UPI002414EB08|nr:hypothetical protein [Halomonas sp. CKK8]WFM71822.1 hypothetical protein P8934_02195 [Halomonas sp. CKK8]
MQTTPPMGQQQAKFMAVKQADVPDTYSPDWLTKLDGRTRVAQIVNERLYALEQDLGGHERLSYQRRSLAKRAVWMEAIIEKQEAALARDQEVDLGKLAQAVNTLMGILRTLGLDRQTLDVSLADYLHQKDSAP